MSTGSSKTKASGEVVAVEGSGVPLIDEVLQNAGPFGQQLGLGGLAVYAAVRP